MPKCWSKSSKQASIGRAAAVLMFASAVRDGRAMRAPSARPFNCDYRALSANFRFYRRGPPMAPAGRLPPRPRRWAAAVAALIALQDEYRAWLDNLPDNLEGSRLADKLQAICARPRGAPSDRPAARLRPGLMEKETT